MLTRASHQLNPDTGAPMEWSSKLPGVKFRVDAALVRLESMFQSAEENDGRMSRIITSD